MAKAFVIALTVAAAAAVGAPPSTGQAGDGAAAQGAPVVEQMVVFRSGRAVIGRVSTRGLRARVGRKRCAVAGIR